MLAEVEHLFVLFKSMLLLPILLNFVHCQMLLCKYFS